VDVWANTLHYVATKFDMCHPYTTIGATAGTLWQLVALNLGIPDSLSSVTLTNLECLKIMIYFTLQSLQTFFGTKNVEETSSFIWINKLVCCPLCKLPHML
jgi:hypothetical protein